MEEPKLRKLTAEQFDEGWDEYQDGIITKHNRYRLVQITKDGYYMVEEPKPQDKKLRP